MFCIHVSILPHTSHTCTTQHKCNPLFCLSASHRRSCQVLIKRKQSSLCTTITKHSSTKTPGAFLLRPLPAPSLSDDINPQGMLSGAVRLSMKSHSPICFPEGVRSKYIFGRENATEAEQSRVRTPVFPRLSAFIPVLSAWEKHSLAYLYMGWLFLWALVALLELLFCLWLEVRVGGWERIG